MSAIVTARGLALRKDGSALTARVSSGQSVAVMGPAASGKTRLLRVLAGADKAPQGRVELSAPSVWAGLGGTSRRSTPQGIAKRAAGSGGAARVAEALTECGLWASRARSLLELSPGQVAACELLPVLASDGPLLIVDGQLDRLDPWVFGSVWDGIRRRLAHGAALVCATNRADRLALFTSVVALDSMSVRFFGTLEELIRSAGVAEIEVETDRAPEVRALVESFEIEIRETRRGLTMRAPEGREIAAKLLLEGYGDVKVVLVREPTAEEALKAVLAG